MLKNIKTKIDIKLFSKYKFECIKLHQQYANEMELNDQVVEKYTINDTMKHYNKKNYYQYLIEYNNQPVGIVECSKKISKIDNKKYLYLDIIFIDENYRRKQIASDTIKELKEKFKLRIELECWYDLPANNLYKSMEMKEIKTRYVFM